MAVVVRELLTRLGVDADTGNVKSFERAVRSASSSMAQGSSVARGALSVAIGNVLVGAFSRATMAARSFFGSILETNFQAEQLQAQLVTLTGSAEDAAAAFDQIKSFTATTPFELANVTQAFIALKNVGIEPTTDVLTGVGNVAAGSARDITDFAGAVVAATTGEMERLKAFGIVAKQQGSQVEFIFRNQKTTVKKESAEIANYLIGLGETAFAGGLERQSATLGGRLSNLKDNVSLFALAVGEAGLNAALKELIGTLIGTTAEAKPLAATLGKVLGAAVRRVNLLVLTLKRNSDVLIRSFKILGVAVGALALARAAKGLGEFLTTMRALNAVAKVAALKMLIIGAAVLLVLLAIEDLIAFMQGRDSVIGDALGEGSGQAEALRKNIQDLVDGFKAIGAALGEAFSDLDISPGQLIAGIFVAIVVTIAKLIEGLVIVGRLIGQGLAMAVLWLVDAWNAASDAVWSMFQAVGDAFSAIVAGLVWVGSSIANLVLAINDAINAAIGAIIDFFVSLARGIIDAFLIAFRFVVDLATGFVDLLVSIWSGIITLVQENVLDPLKAAFEAVFDFIEGVIDATIGRIEDAIGIAKDAAGYVSSVFGDGEAIEVTTEQAAMIRRGLGLGGGGGGSSEVNVNVGAVNVAGSTNMGERQLSRAVAKGTEPGIDRALRETERALANG